MNLKAILLITTVIFLVAITSNLAAGQIEQLQNVTEVDSIKSLTNYDKILRAIIDECSVRSIPLNNEMTLLERIGCIDIVDRIIERGLDK